MLHKKDLIQVLNLAHLYLYIYKTSIIGSSLDASQKKIRLVYRRVVTIGIFYKMMRSCVGLFSCFFLKTFLFFFSIFTLTALISITLASFIRIPSNNSINISRLYQSLCQRGFAFNTSGYILVINNNQIVTINIDY